MSGGAYIARVDLGAQNLTGVNFKIKSQISALRKAGFNAKLISIRSGSILSNDEYIRLKKTGLISRRLNHYYHFWNDALIEVKSLDFIYIRFQGAGPGILNFLSKFRSMRPHAHVILEIPTFPYRGERQNVREHLLGFIDDICVAKLRKYVDRVVTFSNCESIFGIPTLQTQNGVDVDALLFVSPPPIEQQLRLVGLANFSYWHGYDRVIDGLSRLPQNLRRHVVVDFVGSGSETARLKRLAAERGVEDAVQFHGPLSGHRLNQVMDRAHLGLGCLGLHRLSKDTSDLKSREYCARGRPFIADRLENDFLPVSDLIYVCPADDTPVDIAKIWDWYSDIDVNQSGSRLRAHAEAHLTWDAKMAPVTEWLASRLGSASLPRA
jgi:glycosyltransferase involved in cell wall biosynthesis